MFEMLTLCSDFMAVLHDGAIGLMREFFRCSFFFFKVLGYLNLHPRHCLSYHIAEKKIPSVEGMIDGIKLEQFIFDAFPHAPTLSLFEVWC